MLDDSPSPIQNNLQYETTEDTILNNLGRLKNKKNNFPCKSEIVQNVSKTTYPKSQGTSPDQCSRNL